MTCLRITLLLAAYVLLGVILSVLLSSLWTWALRLNCVEGGGAPPSIIEIIGLFPLSLGGIGTPQQAEPRLRVRSL